MSAVPAEAIFSHLAKTPDIDGLLQEYPQLTVDDLRSYFAEAQSLARRASTVTVWKGTNSRILSRMHGLPDPDPSIHKSSIIRALVRLFKSGKMLDLGAGKGNFSLSAAEPGCTVTAVDARTVRWADADAEPDPAAAGLIRTMRWVMADVRKSPIEPGEYEYGLVCVLGLLHHHEVAAQVSLLKRCSTMPTLVDTRIAKAIVDVEGHYEGMLILEHGETRDQRDALPQASWGNPHSFQNTEEALLRLVLGCGYVKIMQMRPPHRIDYTFYLCLPSHGKSEDKLARHRERRAKRKQTGQLTG